MGPIHTSRTRLRATAGAPILAGRSASGALALWLDRSPDSEESYRVKAVKGWENRSLAKRKVVT